MNSPKFAPKTELKSAGIESLIIAPSAGKLGGFRSITASSAQEDLAAAKAMDGDPTTFWHSAWQSSPAKFPHELVLEFEAPRTIAGFTALPRQDGNRNGVDCRLRLLCQPRRHQLGATGGARHFCSGCAGEDGSLSCTGDRAASSSWLRLRGHANGPWASLAELNLIPAKPHP